MEYILALLGFLAAGSAQQIYIPAEGPTTRPQCLTCYQAQPTYAFSEFQFTMNETVRTATSIPPATTTNYYGPPPTTSPGASYTSWGSWNPNATTTATDIADPYGQAAWTSLWELANPPNFTETGIYSTTVSPTPVPSSELVLPPRDYFGPEDCYNFPDDFMFGVSGSASQIEGATASEGKGPTLMDLFIKTNRAKDYVTNENYYLYKQDIERLAAMGVKYYSFSIPWSRILPFALPGTPINQQAIDHYDDLINFVLEKGMLPTVTLLHFDTPFQFFAGNLSAIGVKVPGSIGYTNGGYQNSTFEDAFVNYAKIAMSQWSDRVPIWFTYNEPLLYATNGVAINNVIKSHARVYHWYKEELGGTGQIAMKFNDNFGVPRDPYSSVDIFAANWFNSIQIGTFCNPINLGIDYPDSFKETVPDYVPLSAEDLAYINGTSDFIGIDPYTATVVAPPDHATIASIESCAANPSSPFFPYCVNQTTTNIYGWDIGYRSQSYVYTTPRYLRAYLNYLWNTFRSPIAITEFGFPVFGESQKELVDQLFDTPRSVYYLSFMSEVLKSIWEDRVHVVGAFAWSFMDNWEFGDYEQQFGIQTVNRTTQTRRYKKSFFDLVDFMKARMPNVRMDDT
ncbi:unnamed protein product [Zymoseptoria tritici ST99CH_3D1]|nr:unnamed protein product [Zymoseptoria tritici ST99CH_3D1]